MKNKLSVNQAIELEIKAEEPFSSETIEVNKGKQYEVSDTTRV